MRFEPPAPCRRFAFDGESDAFQALMKAGILAYLVFLDRLRCDR